MKATLIGIFRLVMVGAAVFLTARADGQASFLNLQTNGDGYVCAGVVLGHDGAMYGMTSNGGSNSVGTVFRVDLQTLNYKVLHTFTTNGNDGYSPIGAIAGNPGGGGSMMIQGRDGVLYGVNDLGGTKGGGTVFKVNTDGTGYQVVYNISNNAEAFINYSLPEPCGLIQGQDGMLYITTYMGGPGYIPDGSIFKINTDGSSYSQLYAFGNYQANGVLPCASVIQGRDGMLYGTTIYCLTGYVQGIVFKIDTNGLGFANIHSFTTTNVSPPSGIYPMTPLMQASDGVLYGTTKGGGSADTGVIFKLNTDGTGYTELHQFDNPNGYYHTGRWPGPLVQDNNGVLYGGVAGISFYKIETDGSNYTEFNVPVPNSNWNAGDTSYTMGPDGSLYGRLFKLQFGLVNYAVTYTFNNNGIDGKNPETALVQGPDGTLYGTTYFGGTNNEGSVFSLSPAGTGYTQLHSFLTNGIDGQVPTALLRGTDGMLYGTTPIGGTNNVGTVFRLNSNGSGYSLLHTFVTNGIDGRNAVGLLQGNDANLYGIAKSGGTNNVGLVFKMNTSGGAYTLLHVFITNGVDGQHVLALAQGSDNLLYGATSSGGSNNFGTVFKMNTNGGAYAVLHAFLNNGVDGQLPEVVFQGRDGMLYGVCQYGGSNNVGTVFKLDASGGTHTLLHTFSSTGYDGKYPTGLMQANDGNLYGTTTQGGIYNIGTIFKLNSDGSGYAVAHNFDTTVYLNLSANQIDGLSPRASLWQGLDGALYGTTTAGGTNNAGIIFRLALNNGNFGSFAFGADKTFQLAVTGAALNYRIDASTNLLNWLTVAYVTNSAGSYHYVDPIAANFTRRFYRVHSSP
jgi:uncharacterized repeat protein (TIGR03803 family)